MYRMVTTENLNRCFRLGNLERVENPTIYYDSEDNYVRKCLKDIGEVFKKNFTMCAIDKRRPTEKVPYGALYVTTDITLKNKQFIGSGMNCLFLSRNLEDEKIRKRLARMCEDLDGYKIMTSSIGQVRFEILILLLMIAPDTANIDAAFRIRPENVGTQEKIDTVYVDDIGLFNENLENHLAKDWIAPNKLGELNEEKDRLNFDSYIDYRMERCGLIDWKDFPVMADGLRAIAPSKNLFTRSKALYLSEALESLFGPEDILEKLEIWNQNKVKKTMFRKKGFWDIFLLKCWASFGYIEEVIDRQDEILESYRLAKEDARADANQELYNHRLTDDARNDYFALQEEISLQNLEAVKKYILAALREMLVQEMLTVVTNSSVSDARKEYREIMKEIKHYVADSAYFMQDKNLRQYRSMLDRIKVDWPNQRAMVSSSTNDREIARDREVALIHGLAEKTVIMVKREPIVLKKQS